MDRERWGYHTTLLRAEPDRPGVRENTARHEPAGELARFTPLARVPELNELGGVGWELLSIQPVLAGDDEDVFIGSRGQTGGWSHTHHCALRRRVS